MVEGYWLVVKFLSIESSFSDFFPPNGVQFYLFVGFEVGC